MLLNPTTVLNSLPSHYHAFDPVTTEPVEKEEGVGLGRGGIGHGDCGGEVSLLWLTAIQPSLVA